MDVEKLVRVLLPTSMKADANDLSWEMDKIELLSVLAALLADKLQSANKVDCGLLSGSFGEIIYLYKYSEIDSAYNEIADCQLQRIFDSFRNIVQPHTYCRGLAALG